ncbi:MAG: RNB domain-containing ribonuclease, partial [Ramlibacter sp.]
YNGHQAGMERFWTLKYLQQQGITELVGTVFKEGLVRADELPLVLPVLGGADLPRGAHVRLRLGEIDPITLDVGGTVIERLDLAPEPLEAEDEGEDEPVAGPIAIAVDVNEPEDNPAS